MIYLATPLFDEAAREYASALTAAIERIGHRVYYPWRDAGDSFYRTLPDTHDADWCRAIFSENVAALKRCTSVVAVLDGADVDSGVAWEVGYARAIGKDAIGLRSDFRVHANADLRVNLMLAHACSAVVTGRAELLRRLDAMPRPRVVTPREVTTFYSAVAAEYDDPVLHPNTSALRTAAMEVAETLATPRPIDCVLDIGGGTSSLICGSPARIRMVAEPAVGMILARRDPTDVISVCAPIEHLALPQGLIDRAFCVLAADHVTSLSDLLARTRAALRVGGELIVVFQEPEEELAHRRDANYFEFESVAQNTVFRVRSNIRQLRDFSQHLPEGLNVTAETTRRSSRFRVSSVVGVRCVRAA